MAHEHLLAEWNRLVPVAISQGYRPRGRTPVGFTMKPYLYWKVNRQHAEAAVAWIRNLTNGMPQPSVILTQPTVHVMTFGVELECMMPEGMTHLELARLIDTAGVPCSNEMYNHHTRPHWKVITDGSLGSYERGAEVVSPILSGEDGFAQVRNVCEVLAEANCTVTTKCGFHVHVGARHLPLSAWKNMIMFYQHFGAAIDSFMAPSRRGTSNLYCQPSNFTESQMNACYSMHDLRHLNREIRYRKLNLNSFWRHGTVEFRHHQGTCEARKAEMWLRLCLNIVEFCSQPAVLWGSESLEQMFNVLGTEQTIRDYFINRAAAFARRENRSIAA